ncbi:Zinc metalloprotease RasP [Geodia barretti]|uniref:Zinc metalloprotease RasP n=1 Tax=Geodia barretti TaxID=519541 RepID=A0AA35WKV1_GEOBA|nr:Zinc metalloprotease RasP [Geodia barretti]
MDTWIIAVASFVPMLLLLVVVHELGHFWSAKAFGIKVLEFGVGYPPRAVSIYTGRTETLLTPGTVCLNASIGAVRPGQVIRVLSGENPEGQLVAHFIELPESGRWGGLLQSLVGLAGFGRGPQSESNPGQIARRRLDDVQTDEYLRHEGRVREVLPDRIVLADMIYSVNWLPLGGFVRLSGENNPAAPGSLARRGVGQRAIVLAAGSAMNALFPIVAFAIMFMVPHTEMVGGSAEITSVAPNSPAEAAGLFAGDRVLQVGDQPSGTPQELPREVHLSAGTEMTWIIERDGQRQVAQVTPRVNPPPGEGAVGITFAIVDQQEVRRIEPPWTAARLGVTSTWDMLTLMGREIRGWFGGGRGPELSGPIGIAQITGEVTRQGGLEGWVLVAILLSINLAVLNILPIPMLDGGRLLFVFIEWVRGGKRVPSEKEGLVHLIGFVALLALVIAISANDIIRLVRGISPLGG